MKKLRKTTTAKRSKLECVIVVKISFLRSSFFFDGKNRQNPRTVVAIVTANSDNTSFFFFYGRSCQNESNLPDGKHE